MILVIDTTNREEIKIGLHDKGATKFLEAKTQDQSADILPTIDNNLRRNKLSLKNLKAIAVNQGPGSFTGIRVGIAVANALAWSLNLPVLGYHDDEFVRAIKNIRGKNFSKIVLPRYL